MPVATLKPVPKAWKPCVRKVCGVTRPADAHHAVRSGANAIGLIFYPPSPRAVTVAQARRLTATIPPGVRRVGVFVSERPATIAAAVREARLNVVQLHGKETPEGCDLVRQEVGDGVELWKAVRVGPRFDGSGLSAFDADAFLLDTGREGMYGGTGESFPWDLALHAKRFGRVVLAGGLDGSNVAEAVRAARPWGVDSSSRLESRPGVKDPEKVARYLDSAR